MCIYIYIYIYILHANRNTYIAFLKLGLFFSPCSAQAFYALLFLKPWRVSRCVDCLLPTFHTEKL